MRRVWAVIFIAAAALAVWLWFAYYGQPVPAPSNNSAFIAATSTSNSLTLPGGRISLSYPPDFGLVVAGEPLPVQSYIPPCDQQFQYCIYYSGTAYQGTNFESAGTRINPRTDLTTERMCLSTPPAGFGTKPAATSSRSTYSTSVFAVGDAAAGHYANGMLYRLYFGGNCYEFETRIGESQFANYPPGVIQQFTDAERTDLFGRLRGIIDSITLNGSAVAFPPAPTSTVP